MKNKFIQSFLVILLSASFACTTSCTTDDEDAVVPFNPGMSTEDSIRQVINDAHPIPDNVTWGNFTQEMSRVETAKQNALQKVYEIGDNN